MTDFLLTLLNMSLVSSLLILALLIVRPLLRKAPKAFVCALWALVGLRLVCPITLESSLSLIPTSEPISKDVILTAAEPLGEEAFEALDTQRIIISNTLASPAGASINPMQAISLVAAFIWAVGAALMLIISLVSFLRLRKSVSASINTGGNVFINDDIASPFVLGLVTPRIYIPSSLTEYEKEYVIAHENAHIKRRDYLFKPIGYIILSLHWFNPLVWVAYILLCRDIEAACDQRVIKEMDTQGKKEYSTVLLRLSMPSKKIRACPVAFGEVGVKSRIKGVVNYRKPAFWICIVAVLLTVVLTVGFLTNPLSEEGEENKSKTYTLDERISKAIVDNNRSQDAEGRFVVENYVELTNYTFNSDAISYIWAYYGEFEEKDGNVTLSYESYKPAKVTLKKVNDNYVLVDYDTPERRKDTCWVRDQFPDDLFESAAYTPGYYNDQKKVALETAQLNFGKVKNSNEFLPTFNAEVLEVYDDYMIVSPLKGETVSRNTFEKIRLNTRHLTPTSFQPSAGDMIRVRYVDIITLDTDPPTLTKVLNFEELKTREVVPFVLYSGEDTAYYFSDPAFDKVYVYRYDGLDMWFPGTYFSLNENMKTFMLTYKDLKNEEIPRLVSGNYDVYDEVLVLRGYDLNDNICELCFTESGTNCYRFSVSKTIDYNSAVPGVEFEAENFKLPFEDGAEFVLGTGLS